MSPNELFTFDQFFSFSLLQVRKGDEKSAIFF